MLTPSNLISRKVISFWYIPRCPTVDLDSQKKEKNNTSQMRLRSVFKMRTSILNTATTEQMGCIIFFFFRLHEIYKLRFWGAIRTISSEGNGIVRNDSIEAFSNVFLWMNRRFEWNILKTSTGFTFKVCMRNCLAIETISMILAGDLHDFS